MSPSDNVTAVSATDTAKTANASDTTPAQIEEASTIAPEVNSTTETAITKKNDTKEESNNLTEFKDEIKDGIFNDSDDDDPEIIAFFTSLKQTKDTHT